MYTDSLLCEDALALFYLWLPWFGFSLVEEVVASCLGYFIVLTYFPGHSVLNIRDWGSLVFAYVVRAPSFTR